MIPFLTTLPRYSPLIGSGHSESPEHVLTTDRVLLVAEGVRAAVPFTALYRN